MNDIKIKRKLFLRKDKQNYGYPPKSIVFRIELKIDRNF